MAVIHTLTSINSHQSALSFALNKPFFLQKKRIAKAIKNKHTNNIKNNKK